MARKATRAEPSALTHPEDRRDAARRARAEVRFDEQAMLGALFGEFDANLVQIENRLGVLIAARGNKVVIEGSEDDVARARDVLVTMLPLLFGQYVYVRWEANLSQFGILPPAGFIGSLVMWCGGAWAGASGARRRGNPTPPSP